MDDNRKIQAILIYFKHWGADEAWEQRRHQGIHRLMENIHSVFFDDGEEHTMKELAREVQMFNTWTTLFNTHGANSLPSMWFNIIDTLLRDMGGCPFDTNTYIQPSREAVVSANTKMKVWKIYDMCLSEEDLLSVDSIVAWL